MSLLGATVYIPPPSIASQLLVPATGSILPRTSNWQARHRLSSNGHSTRLARSIRTKSRRRVPNPRQWSRGKSGFTASSILKTSPAQEPSIASREYWRLIWQQLKDGPKAEEKFSGKPESEDNWTILVGFLFVLLVSSLGNNQDEQFKTRPYQPREDEIIAAERPTGHPALKSFPWYMKPENSTSC